MQQRKHPQSRGKPRSGSGKTPSGKGFSGKGKAGDSGWLYGLHTVRAALANPQRQIWQVLAADDALATALIEIAQPLGRSALIEKAPRESLAQYLPPGAVHQGVALLSAPLPEIALEDICAAATDNAAARPPARIVVLDQVTDPHNVGAIIRSAAAFGALGIIVQDRHTPLLGGVLAKAASGGLETCPLIRVTNLSRALDTLKAAGFWCVGLDAAAEQTLRAACNTGPMALVLGAEGAGLRRLTRENCDVLAAIPLVGDVASLNVSNAAAIALYELAVAGA